MAGLGKRFTQCAKCLLTSQRWKGAATIRCMSAQSEAEGERERVGWLTNLLAVRTLEPSRESHSTQLSSKETVYEIQFHAIKPECMEDYLNQFKEFKQLIEEKNESSELVGSWTVEVGDQDEAVHLWAYKGGYPVLNETNRVYRTDKDFIEFRKNRNKMLRSRKNQIILAFAFWPEMAPRPPTNIYELRSYTLKPGTMIEWGNFWAKGIKSRGTNNEPVAGYFTQMGELQMVHHIWAYTDLESRKVTREAAWERPGWDQCVAHTVPLIRHMQSRILIPTPFSPLQ